MKDYYQKKKTRGKISEEDTKHRMGYSGRPNKDSRRNWNKKSDY